MLPHENIQPMALNREIEAKRGYLSMGFEVDSSGRSILRHLHRRVPIVVQQALYFDEQLPSLPCVYILSSGGPYVDGDRYEHHISLGPNAMAHISTGAATKVATMEYDHCRLTQTFHLAEGSYLEWIPEPTIPHRGARLVAHTAIDLHPTASLFYAESYTCGRLYHGECFDYDLLEGSLVAQCEGRVLLRERWRVEPHTLSPERLSALGPYRHHASVVMFAPAEIVGDLYEQFTPRYTPSEAMSISLLSGGVGLVVRLLANSTEVLKARIHSLGSAFRLRIKGKPLPDRFPWR